VPSAVSRGRALVVVVRELKPPEAEDCVVLWRQILTKIGTNILLS